MLLLLLLKKGLLLLHALVLLHALLHLPQPLNQAPPPAKRQANKGEYFPAGVMRDARTCPARVLSFSASWFLKLSIPCSFSCSFSLALPES
jgi:hypothetical protein